MVRAGPLRVLVREGGPPPTDARPAQLPVVLVHGAVVSGRYMLPTAERLATDRRVWVPDLPGFGGSEHPPHPLGVPELASALAAILEEGGQPRVHLLGNSLGAQVVAEFALRWPGRTASATLVGPTVDRDARSRLGQLWRLVRDAVRERPSLIPLHLADSLRAGPRSALGSLDAALADRIEEKLPRLGVPVLIVGGADDPLAPAAWCAWLASMTPGARLEIIEGPHALNYSRPAQLSRVVREFLADVEGGEPAHRPPPDRPPEG